MMSTTARPPLPVLQTVSEAFHSVPANWLAVLRIFWFWGLLTVGCLVLFLQSFPPLAGAPQPGQVPEMPDANFFVLVALLIVLGLLGFSATAVGWHRLLLLGEQPPAIYIGIGWPALRYLGRCVLIGLIAIPIMWVCALVVTVPMVGTLGAPAPQPSGGYLVALSLIMLVAMLPAWLVMSRLFIALPGIAIGGSMTLGESWRISAGNTWRLFGGSLLVYLPAFAISLAFQLSLGAQSEGLMGTLLGMLVNFLVTVAGVSFLSFSYRFLVGLPAAS